MLVAAARTARVFAASQALTLPLVYVVHSTLVRVRYTYRLSARPTIDTHIPLLLPFLLSASFIHSSWHSYKCAAFWWQLLPGCDSVQRFV